MAWNPAPEVAVARDVALRLKARMCIIVYVTDDGTQLGMASYGKTKALCAKAGKIGDRVYDAAREHFEEEAALDFGDDE